MCRRWGKCSRAGAASGENRRPTMSDDHTDSVSWGAYSGNWPPMVVIESGSMEHDNNSLYAEPGYTHLGTIDTGDLVIVKEAGKQDIVTYLKGKDTGYEKYGDFGDVIVYYKNGIRTYNDQSVTPVIHRAMFWVDVDVENKTYHVPEAGRTFYNKIDLGQFGDDKLVGTIEGEVLQNSGFVTKGDSYGNPHPDQVTHFDINGNKVQPITWAIFSLLAGFIILTGVSKLVVKLQERILLLTFYFNIKLSLNNFRIVINISFIEDGSSDTDVTVPL